VSIDNIEIDNIEINYIDRQNRTQYVEPWGLTFCYIVNSWNVHNYCIFETGTGWMDYVCFI